MSIPKLPNLLYITIHNDYTKNERGYKTVWDISNIIIDLKNNINALTASQAGIATAVDTLSDNYTALEARVKALEDAQPTPDPEPETKKMKGE